MGRQQALKQPTFPLWHPPHEAQSALQAKTARYQPAVHQAVEVADADRTASQQAQQHALAVSKLTKRVQGNPAKRTLEKAGLGLWDAISSRTAWNCRGWGSCWRKICGGFSGAYAGNYVDGLCRAKGLVNQAVAATGPVLTSTQEHVLHKSATGLRALASTVFPAAYQCGSHSWNHRSESSRESHLAHTIFDAADVAMEPVKNSTTGFLFGKGLWQTGGWHPRPLRWRHHGWPTATGLTQERATRPAQTTQSSFPRPARTSPSRSRHGKRLWHMLPRLEDPQWAR